MKTFLPALPGARRAMIELKLAAVIFALVAGMVAITLEWRAAHPAKAKGGLRTIEHHASHHEKSNTISAN